MVSHGAEIHTQKRVIELFKDQLGYIYLGSLHEQDNKNINTQQLTQWLSAQGYSIELIRKALMRLDQDSALGQGKNLYEANQAVYNSLRYGIRVKEGAGETNQSVWLIDWKNPHNNQFYIAEEVSVQGENKKRPDIVLYVNGIALAVLELKRSGVNVTEGIRQNLDNQKRDFIRNFFSTVQLIMAGNDSQGLRYGTIETPEAHYYQWKTIQNHSAELLLDDHLAKICNKETLLEIIHDFIVFDAGTKKTCRHNQYFGVKEAQQRVLARKGGVIWHTQGSGKSLTMVWLAKWIRENISNARVLIITDRTELDEQIEKVFLGVQEKITKSTSGKDLLTLLNQTTPWLICSLVHKFGRTNDEDEDWLAQFDSSLLDQFKAKGDLFVFVDECHRTQSGKLHSAMLKLLPEATFIGFTGTPLLKNDKKTSEQTFGTYIHKYKFDEAVADGVVLDLQYEARDINQDLSSPDKVDIWFEAKTSGLTDMAKLKLKEKWGTIKKVFSSRQRLKRIVNDIVLDFDVKPRLSDGRGNAMLVCSSIYEACRVYEMFAATPFKGKCAIITSYTPAASDIKGEESGAGATEKVLQYEIYTQMLADFFEEPVKTAINKVSEFEKLVKKRFIESPAQMKLLIVVDKLLTGFDAPSATYLYIDKNMQDHGLFQAICRVNRLDGDDKDYGYIVDYKDLFKSLGSAIKDYTAGPLDSYDDEDIEGLIKDRLKVAREKLLEAREQIRALCEPVMEPKEGADFIRYFCRSENAIDEMEELKANEHKRVSLYKANASFIRAYANIANEILLANFSETEAEAIKAELKHYEEMTRIIKNNSGDFPDMKLYEPAMRHLLDTYLDADESKTLIDFKNMGLVDLLIQGGASDMVQAMPEKLQADEDAVAETITNNIRKLITEEKPVNPKYFESMSALLETLVQERRSQAKNYAEFLDEVRRLAEQIKNYGKTDDATYPSSINTAPKRALYDNLGHDEHLALKVDAAVVSTKKEGFVGNKMKEREILREVHKVLASTQFNTDEVFELIKAQVEYH